MKKSFLSRKTMCCWFLILVLVLTCIPAMPAQAGIKKYTAFRIPSMDGYEHRVKAGGKYFFKEESPTNHDLYGLYCTKKDYSKKKLLDIDNRTIFYAASIEADALTNGSTVYYVRYSLDRKYINAYNSLSYRRATICSVKTNGKKMKSYKATSTIVGYDQMIPVGVYNHNLYYVIGSQKEGYALDSSLYRMSLITKKTKKVCSGFYPRAFDGSNRYIYGQANGSYTNGILVFDCKTNKVIKKIKAAANPVEIAGGKLCYSVTKYSSGVSTTKVFRCNPNGKGKKKCIFKKNISGVVKITAKKIYFYADGNYYEYTIKTKKEKPIERSQIPGIND